MNQRTLRFPNPGRGTREITAQVNEIVAQGRVGTGLCHLFCRHSSASLMICENADPAVLADLERWLQRAVPDGDPLFTHNAEGHDDMPAHVRSVLTGMEVTVPVSDGRLNLGTWQGIFLYEHRYAQWTREVVVTLWGDSSTGC